MTCNQLTDRLLDYLSDDSRAPTRMAARAHLRRCRNCRVYVRGYRAATALVRRFCIDDDPPLCVPDDLLHCVLAALPQA
ncbi:MAG: anti-sigma factor [Deltaproteobacteria bacterium]|nr:anti-sigma factor [Deltaproteobacteria bacterium]